MCQMDMLHGSLWDKILLFALPLAGSSILQQLFNSADVAVVGRFFLQFYTTEENVIEFAIIRMIHALAFSGLTAIYEVGGDFLRGLGHSMLSAL